LIYASTLVNLYMICWCIIFRAIQRGTGQPEDLILLTIASGLFAQFALSTKVDPGFMEIANLGAVAASIVRNYGAGPQKTSTGSQGDLSSKDGDDSNLLSGTGVQSPQVHPLSMRWVALMLVKPMLIMTGNLAAFWNHRSKSNQRKCLA
jgi:hypothetical protein